jgi:hypothetical protein
MLGWPDNHDFLRKLLQGSKGTGCREAEEEFEGKLV